MTPDPAAVPEAVLYWGVSARPPQITDPYARGRTLTRLLLGALFVLVVTPMLEQWRRGATGSLGMQALTLLGTAFLLMRVYAGGGAARTVTVALCILGGSLGFLAGMVGSSLNAYGIILMLVSAAFIGIGLTLVSYPPVRDFLDRHQVVPRPGTRR